MRKLIQTKGETEQMSEQTPETKQFNQFNQYVEDLIQNLNGVQKVLVLKNLVNDMYRLGSKQAKTDIISMVESSYQPNTSEQSNFSDTSDYWCSLCNKYHTKEEIIFKKPHMGLRKEAYCKKYTFNQLKVSHNPF